MTKKNKSFDNRQITLFDLIRTLQDDSPEAKPAGCMDIDRQFRELISDMLRRCPRSRYQVAARMSELVGQEITKSMLDSYTAESKVQNRFPAVFVPAFCEAVGGNDPVKLLGKPIGSFVLPGPDALRAEIQRIDEEITKKQADRRRRMTFLKEMEGEK